MISSKNRINFFFLAIILSYGIYCALTIGKSWDSFFFIDIGKNRLSYLMSFGSSDFEERIISQLYPATYNTLSAFFLQIFPRSFELEAYHFLNFSISFLGAVGLYRLTKKLFNKNIGVLTFFIFILYPIFFGHMAVNDRDTVVLFSHIWITYYIFKYLDLNKKKNKRYIYYISIFLALGLGVRFAFAATLIPIIFYGLYIIYKKKLKIKSKDILLDCLKVVLISISIVILFWVPTHEDLINKPLELIRQSFDRGWGYPFAFVNGVVFESNNVSSFYILKNLFFKTPEYILFLYLLFIFFLKDIGIFYSELIKDFSEKTIFVLINIFFPSMLLLLNPYAIYDGMRLFLFIIPYFAIIPGLTLFYLLKSYKRRLNKFLLFFIGGLSFYFLIFFITITPYHYTYLNIFTGTFSNTINKFENDYWGTSLKELIIRMNKNKLITSRDYVKINICGLSKGSVKYYLKKNKNIKYKLVGEDQDPDFIMLSNRVLWNYDAKKNIKNITCFDKYKGKNIVEVRRRGLVLSAIKELNN